DHDGRIVVRSPGGDGWIGRSFADDPFARAVIAGGSDGVARAASFDGVPRRFAYAALANAGGAPWHVTVGVPDAAITSVVHALLAVAVGVAIGLVVIACRRVESDARALVRSAQSLPSGPGATTTTQAAVLPELAPVSKAIAGTAAIVERREKELIDQHEDVSR